jgi:hypothetical protein
MLNREGRDAGKYLVYRLKLDRGRPKVLSCDNGSEFTSPAMER